MAQQQQQQQQQQKQQQQQQQQQQKQPKKQSQQLQPQPRRATDPQSLAPLRVDSLGVPASMAGSTVSLPTTNGSNLGVPRLYQPGNKSPLAAHRVTDSPGVLRRLVLSNSRSGSPRPVSVGELPNGSPAALRRPSSNPVMRSTSMTSSLSATVKVRRSSSRCSAYSKGSGSRVARLTSMSSNREARTYSVGSGQYNYGFDGDEVDMESGFSGPRGMDGAEAGEDEAFVEDMVVIERPIYTQSDFDEGFEGGKRPERNVRTWAQGKARKCECSCSCIGRFFREYLPFLAIMSDYSFKRDFLADIIAGLTVGIMHIPQGMAYGQLSTLPPVFGLYVSFFPVILYFFLGTSKHVSIGTFAVVSLMVGSAVDKGLRSRELVPMTWNETIIEGNETTQVVLDNSAEILDVKLKYAMAVTFAVGVLQLLLGLFRLGFLTVYLSDPLISGFTTGAACHVFTSQVKHIFGISMGRYSGAFKLLYSYRDIFMNLPDTNAVTFIASLLCMLILFVVKEYINNNPRIKPHLKMPVPIELIVVVLGTVISFFVKLEETYDVKIVGDIPVGIPPPNLKAFPYLNEVIADAIAIGIVAFAISVSMAKIFANKHDYAVDSNQELLAYGACNIFSSFFSSFVSAVSLSRSLVQENVGSRTQVTGLVSSCLVVIVLLVVGPYFETLPNCILASIILVALKGMFKQFLELKNLWKISIIDFTVWLVTFSATALLDVDLGLLVGVVYALLTVIIRSQRPYSCILGQVPGTDIYKDISVYKVAEETPNVKIFRFDSALFFANSEFFKSSLYKLTVNPNDLKEKLKKLNKKKKKEDKEQLNIQVETPDTPVVDRSPVPGGKEAQNGQGVVVTGSTVDTDGASSSGTRDTQSLTDIQYIILDCSTMSYVDSMGVKVLRQVISELKTFNITVYLAQCKSSVREMFETTGFYNTGSRHYMFITIHDAVVSAQLNQWSISVENENAEAVNANNNAPNDIGNEDDGAEDGKTSQDAAARGNTSVAPDSTNSAASDQNGLQQKDGADKGTKDSDSKDMERTEV